MDMVYTRSYLEGLVFSDLIDIADKNGIDVPENLNRNFLIAEILEAAYDNKRTEKDEMQITENSDFEENKLPEMYNSTEINMVLQNPVWAFVFWNINDTDLNILKHEDSNSLFLRVSSFHSADSTTPVDRFDIKISIGTKEQYVLLPSDSEFVAVELYANISKKENRLAASKIVERSRASILRLLANPGEDYKLNDIMELSGTRKLLHKHYMSYRQLFC